MLLLTEIYPYSLKYDGVSSIELIHLTVATRPQTILCIWRLNNNKVYILEKFNRITNTCFQIQSQLFSVHTSFLIFLSLSFFQNELSDRMLFEWKLCTAYNRTYICMQLFLHVYVTAVGNK